jgi:hypothetical protein
MDEPGCFHVSHSRDIPALCVCDGLSPPCPFTYCRSVKIEADLGYIEYLIMLQHRSSWQDIMALYHSKAEMQSYCLELSKKLDMRYKSPPLPVNLSLHQKEEGDSPMGNDTLAEKMAGLTANSEELRKLSALFDKK